MTEARQLAASLPPLAKVTALPVRSTLSTRPLPANALAILRGLPERLGDLDYAMAKEMAAAPVPELSPVDPQYFSVCLRKLGTLPRKNDDEKTGEERTKIYARMLGSNPVEAIDFLMETAFKECRWFPTVAECLDILARWKRNDEPMQAHLLAKTICQRERQVRFDALMGRLARRELDQNEIDALPDRIKEMAEVRAYLWRCDCGCYVARPIPQVSVEQAA